VAGDDKETTDVPTRIFLVPTASDREAVERITANLEQVVGVIKAEVADHIGEVRVRFQRPATETALIEAIEQAGYPVTQ
jgi:copper chaperone CopZ